MTASGRCASTPPFPPAGGQDVQKPLESGPRWSWAALMRWTASVIVRSTSPMAPAIPHMLLLLLVELEVHDQIASRTLVTCRVCGNHGTAGGEDGGAFHLPSRPPRSPAAEERAVGHPRRFQSKRGRRARED